MSDPKPKLILLPGLDGTGKLFKGLVEALSGRFKTQVVSYPPNEVTSYTQLAERLQLFDGGEPVVLIAESYSTPLAIRLAARNPSNLKAVVLCAGFVTTPVGGLTRFASVLVAPFSFRVPLHYWVARFWLLGHGADSALVEDVRAAVAAVSPRVLAFRVRDVLSCDVGAELTQVRVPVLYIQAKQDRLVRPRSFDKIRAIGSRVEKVQIDGPHLILQREPHKAAEIIASYMQRIV
jgi:pimeloyl-[acyl-carrier protein] methyl ester esterase